MNVLRALIREPLVHFLAIGAALFGLYGWLNPQGFADDKVIVVDAGRIAQLQTQYRRTWNRAPTPAELDALIDNYVVEEILYRQALALGLDRDDSVIRRRLRQKMEFLTIDATDLYQPGPGELQAFLDAHPDLFRRDATYSFEQLYFSPDKPGIDALTRANQARLALAQGREVHGDVSLLPGSVTQASAAQVDRTFGSGFAASLDELPPGEWSAPLPSGLGLHLVRLSARRPPTMPTLEQARAQVEREWRNAKNQEARKALLAQLRSRYRIVIERDGAGEGG